MNVARFRGVQDVVADLSRVGGSDALLQSLPRLFAEAPDWLDYEASTWNVAPLNKQARSKISRLDFARYGNGDVGEVCKVYLLWSIVEMGPSAKSLRLKYDAMKSLSDVLQARPLAAIRTEDFHVAEALLAKSYAKGTAARWAGSLQTFATWLALHTGIPLTYKSRLRVPVAHGSRASDAARAEKLPPDEVIAAVVELWARDDLR
ncbi:hypothetical protein [Leisingera sp. ANG59]|uniref:hypothetical protein n=1 Tax=Leisingera sp. ANG59 TaxID=2675221 RepID=UPI0015721B15|nr:hypothetical protein [Leisingera sp. ANG59]NSY41527.1 hypothetical protein [Leisingera sp. ANG59]